MKLDSPQGTGPGATSRSPLDERPGTATPAPSDADLVPRQRLRIGHAGLPPDRPLEQRIEALAAVLDASRGLDLVVTGELALAGGWRSAAPQGRGPGLEAAALRSDDPSLLDLAARCAAAGVGLVLGYAEACSGAVFSSALVIDRSGCALANYRRTHLGGAEWSEIAAGGWLTIVPYATSWRLGLSIGWDLLVPEAARCLALQGAELLVHLGSPGDRAAELVPARAVENALPVVAASSTGLVAADAEGRPLAAAPLSGDGCPVVAVERSDRSASPLTLRRPRLYARLGSIDEG
jgi:predicted amidohydrolase